MKTFKQQHLTHIFHYLQSIESMIKFICINKKCQKVSMNIKSFQPKRKYDTYTFMESSEDEISMSSLIFPVAEACESWSLC